MALRDHRREVGGRVRRAVKRLARVAQHARRRADRDEAQRIDVAVREDRVEHEPLHAVGVRERVALGHVGAIGDAVERELVGAQRVAQQIEVGHGVGRRVEAPLVAERPRAVLDRPGRGRRDVRAAHRALQRRAAQHGAAGAPLVDGDHLVAVQGLAQTALEARRERHAGLSRPAAQADEHAARGVLHRLDGDREAQIAASATAVVERHGQREAVEAGREPALAGRHEQRARGDVGVRFGARRRGGARRVVAAAACDRHAQPHQRHRSPSPHNRSVGARSRSGALRGRRRRGEAAARRCATAPRG